MKEAIQEAKRVVDGFNMDVESYKAIPLEEIGVSADPSNTIYSNTEDLKGLKIVFENNVRNAKIFIGSNAKFDKTSIKLTQSNTMVYFGNDVNLKNLRVLVNRKNTCVIAGNGVTTNGVNKWVIGLGAMGNEASIVVGDDCMFAGEILIRATDGHPIFDLDDDVIEPINLPERSIVIGQYTWVGYGASIVKNVHVGGASIIALGAVVSKDVPQRHTCLGVPAVNKPLGSRLWSRANNEVSKKKMLKYAELYPSLV